MDERRRKKTCLRNDVIISKGKEPDAPPRTSIDLDYSSNVHDAQEPVMTNEFIKNDYSQAGKLNWKISPRKNQMSCLQTLK